jgi:hypothetical protein
LWDSISQTGQSGKTAASGSESDNDARMNTLGPLESEMLEVDGAPVESPAGNRACGRRSS